ncbi:MAG: exo-beta-N-acetylmuramidase NamZ domain-containing protein, partial [Bacteroidota bacterium]
ENPNIGNKAKCTLHVVKMEGWKRWMKFSDTGLAWVPTSPNVPHQETPAYLVSSGVLGELIVFGIGISYTLSFETFTAEWIDADSLAKYMNALKLPGVIFRPISYKPYYGDWKDKVLNGVQIHLVEPDKVNLLEVQFYFMQVHNEMYPKKNPFEITSSSRIKMFDKVMGTNKIREKFTERFLVSDIKQLLDKDLKRFKKLSKRYYLYNYEN